MDVTALLARLDAQRETWVDLPDGKRLKYRRPYEVDLPQFLRGVRIEHVIDYACDWSGFTEADLLGAAVGSSDPLPFHRDLWAAVVRDRARYLPVVAKAMVETAAAYLQKRVDTAKNSEPSSTRRAGSSSRAKSRQ